MVPICEVPLALLKYKIVAVELTETISSYVDTGDSWSYITTNIHAKFNPEYNTLVLCSLVPRLRVLGI